MLLCSIINACLANIIIMALRQDTEGHYKLKHQKLSKLYFTLLGIHISYLKSIPSRFSGIY